MFRLSIALAFLVAAVPSLAHADDGDGAVHDSGRGGGTFGVDVGAGHLDCRSDSSDCAGGGSEAAAGLAIHGGFFVGPNVALVGDLWGMGHTDSNQTVSQGMLTANVRFWPVRRLWLQGGIGAARTTLSYNAGDGLMVESRSDVVPAAMLGIGVEVISARHAALDIELRAGSGFYDNDVHVDNVALGVGVSWY